MTPPTATSGSNEATSSRNLKKVRSGHLARLKKLVNQIENAMSDFQNVKKVLQLQGEVSKALKSFQASSQEYAASLTDADDVQKEVSVAKNHEKANLELNSQIVAWIKQGEQRPVQIPETPGPGSRARSQNSSTAASESEKRRRRWQLELAQETRRQDENRELEEATRADLLREHERKTRIRNILDEYEKACLEEELISEDDSLRNATDGSRAVTFAENTNPPAVQLREFSSRPEGLPAEEGTADPVTNATAVDDPPSLTSSDDTRVPYSPAANQLMHGVSSASNAATMSPTLTPPALGCPPVSSGLSAPRGILSNRSQDNQAGPIDPYLMTDRCHGRYPRVANDYVPQERGQGYQHSFNPTYEYMMSHPPPPQQPGYMPIYSASNNPYPPPYLWPNGQDRIVMMNKCFY